jgi:hypothetical protein
LARSVSGNIRLQQWAHPFHHRSQRALVEYPCPTKHACKDSRVCSQTFIKSQVSSDALHLADEQVSFAVAQPKELRRRDFALWLLVVRKANRQAIDLGLV